MLWWLLTITKIDHSFTIVRAIVHCEWIHRGLHCSGFVSAFTWTALFFTGHRNFIFTQDLLITLKLRLKIKKCHYKIINKIYLFPIAWIKSLPHVIIWFVTGYIHRQSPTCTKFSFSIFHSSNMLLPYSMMLS